MANKKVKIVTGIVICIIIITGFILYSSKKKTPAVTRKIFTPYYGVIKTAVSTTGSILPQNRLEIIPPISGRIENILVKEGERVKIGQTLLWMSSTDRAALIDAARAQGGAQLKYWEDVYKPIPLVAPITGTIIARSMEPGQTATTSTVILVLSDRLIVKANVDETDIGRIKKGQTAEISLDAYPDVKANGHVELIKYESTTVNNVTTYEVNIIPEKVPAVYKSGMSANIEIFDTIKKNVLLLPLAVVKNENGNHFVYINDPSSKDGLKKVNVQTGLEDEQNVEIVSGLSDSSRIVDMQQGYIPQSDDKSGNPFMPQRKSWSAGSSSSNSKGNSSWQGGQKSGPPQN